MNHTATVRSSSKDSHKVPGLERGAGNEIRTRDTKLGKLVLYQLSYARSPVASYKTLT
jgi:hypothetical protein